jgi:hypothetical protein
MWANVEKRFENDCDFSLPKESRNSRFVEVFVIKQRQPREKKIAEGIIRGFGIATLKIGYRNLEAFLRMFHETVFIQAIGIGCVPQISDERTGLLENAPGRIAWRIFTFSPSLISISERICCKMIARMSSLRCHL